MDLWSGEFKRSVPFAGPRSIGVTNAYFAQHKKELRQNSKSFWATPGAKLAQTLLVSKRLALLNKAVAPQLDYRCSRWPPQKMVARELDSMHRKMVGSLLKVQRYPSEDVRRFSEASWQDCFQVLQASWHLVREVVSPQCALE